MRTVLLAMTEETHDKRTWSATSLIATFVFLSLALNASVRELSALVRATSTDNSDTILLFFIGFVTVGQLLSATVLISAENSRGDLPNKEALAIIVFSHVGTTFLHDYLLSLGGTEKSLATSFFQPLFAIIILFLVTAALCRPSTLLGVLAIAAGCTFFSIKITILLQSDRTSLICGLAMFSMILRNITVKQLVFNESVQVKLRDKTTISIALLCGLSLVVSSSLLTHNVWVTPTICAIAICVFSSCLFYVTTHLLRTYSVTFIALFSTWAIVLEAVVVTPLDARPDALSTIAALVLVIIGHYIFMKDYSEHEGSSSGTIIPPYPHKPVNIHEQYTRTEFLLFASFVLGVIFYVFQPKVSERDLENLSYVGLDKVIRRLLAVDDEAVGNE